jgi:hypothetical protein
MRQTDRRCRRALFSHLASVATTERLEQRAGRRAQRLSGHVRLPENLDRAGVAEARCLVACTDDDLGQRAGLPSRPAANRAIRTVARIFDESLAGGGGSGVQDRRGPQLHGRGHRRLRRGGHR